MADVESLPEKVRDRVQPMVTGARIVVVQQHDPVPLLDDAQDVAQRFSIEALTSDRFLDASFSVFSDGRLQETTRSTLLSCITSVEIGEASKEDQEARAEITVVEGENIWATPVSEEIGRHLAGS